MTIRHVIVRHPSIWSYTRYRETRRFPQVGLKPSAYGGATQESRSLAKTHHRPKNTLQRLRRVFGGDDAIGNSGTSAAARAQATAGRHAVARSPSSSTLGRRLGGRTFGHRRRALDAGVLRQHEVRHHGHQEHHGHAVLREHALDQLGEVREQGRHCVKPMPTASDSAAMRMLRCEKPARAIIWKPLTMMLPNIMMVQPPSTASGSDAKTR